MRTSACLTHTEIAQSIASRVLIEQVKGMLMLVYDLDAENAFELLRWGSQTTGGDLHGLARKVALVRFLIPGESVVDLRAACDDLLFAARST